VATAKLKEIRVMLFSGSQTQNALGHRRADHLLWHFIMLAINYFRGKNAFSCALMIFMCLIVLYIAIEGYKKILKSLP
jgi:hypothetical protein